MSWARDVLQEAGAGVRASLAVIEDQYRRTTGREPWGPKSTTFAILGVVAGVFLHLSQRLDDLEDRVAALGFEEEPTEPVLFPAGGGTRWYRDPRG